MSGTLHVVGAGLAGLAAAVAAARSGHKVALYEAARHAGGRCRSLFDERLGQVVDNGTHLVLGANRAALAFTRAVGGDIAMARLPAAFPFLDLRTGERWTVKPGRPPAGLAETLSALGLPWSRPGQTVTARLGRTRSFERLWRPLCEAITNTAPAEASAALFARVLREVLLGGAPAMAPWVFPTGLSAALVAPALATLAAFRGEVRFGRRLVAVEDGQLRFERGSVRLGKDDRVVLALPPWATAQLLPGIPALPTRTIVNAHFRLGEPERLPPGAPFLALVGGTAQWLSWRGALLSVTVSAAEHLAALPGEEIAARLWAEVARPLGLPSFPAAFRVFKERRATLAHTPDALAARPGPATRLPHVFLAGDWLASPWPCTIEAAVASGLAAARLALARPALAF